MAETEADGKNQSAAIAESLGYKYVYEGKKKENDKGGVSCMTGNSIISRYVCMYVCMHVCKLEF